MHGRKNIKIIIIFINYIYYINSINKGEVDDINTRRPKGGITV